MIMIVNVTVSTIQTLNCTEIILQHFQSENWNSEIITHKPKSHEYSPFCLVLPYTSTIFTARRVRQVEKGYKSVLQKYLLTPLFSNVTGLKLKPFFVTTVQSLNLIKNTRPIAQSSTSFREILWAIRIEGTPWWTIEWQWLTPRRYVIFFMNFFFSPKTQPTKPQGW